LLSELVAAVKSIVNTARYSKLSMIDRSIRSHLATSSRGNTQKTCDLVEYCISAVRKCRSFCSHRCWIFAPCLGGTAESGVDLHLGCPRPGLSRR